MAGSIDLRPGMRLNVMRGGDMLSASYESVIRRVTADGLSIDRPEREGERLDLGPGDDVTLAVQVHGRLYTFISSVLEVQDIPAMAVVITQPQEVTHNERRQFFRLLTSIDPRYAARTNGEGEEIERLDARILDLSGGGVQLRVNRWVPVGARVRLIFSLNVTSVEVDVTVLALSVQRPDSRRTFYRVNCRFIEIAREVQESIIRFIFQQQRLLRQTRAV